MLLTVARIGRAHGLRGEVALDLRTDNPEDRFGVGAVLATEPAARGPLTVVSTRTQQDRWYVTFAQISDRTTAEASYSRRSAAYRTSSGTLAATIKSATATRQAMNSSGIRPASRLGPWPLSRRIERVRPALIGRRTMSAPRGDASSPMNAGRSTSLTIGPPPRSTTRSTRAGARWARVSAQTSPIDVPTIEAESRPSASSTPARISAATSW